MSNDATLSIREDWTRLSGGWEQQRAYLLEMSRPIHDWLVSALDASHGQRVLELGAGTGDTGFLAAQRLGPTGKLVSSDLSPAMVDVARRRAAELGIQNAEFQTVDAQAMPFPDASFDGVICRWGYMLMPDPATALAETQRVLKPGGNVVFAVFTSAAENPWAALPSRLLVERGHMPPAAPGTPGILALGDRGRLEALVAGAGLVDARIEAVSFAWRFHDLAEYWTFLVEITALGPTIQSLPSAERDAYRDALPERVAPFRQGERLDLPARCWLVRATRSS